MSARRNHDHEAEAEERKRVDRVAEVCGVTRQTVRAWLRGRHRPGMLARAALLANGFTVDCQPVSKPTRRNAGCHDRPFTVREVLALPSVPPDPRWRERALCASSPDPDAWWPDDEDDPGTEARAICARCPVLTLCRDAFLADPWPDRHCIVAGVWGQTLLAEAQRERRARKTRKEAA